MALEIKWVRYPRVRPCNESIRTPCCRGWNRSVVQNQSGSSLFLSTSMANRVWIVLICAYRASYGVYLLVFTKVSVGLHAHKTILRFRDGRVFSSRREVFFRNPFSSGFTKPGTCSFVYGQIQYSQSAEMCEEISRAALCRDGCSNISRRQNCSRNNRVSLG